MYWILCHFLMNVILSWFFSYKTFCSIIFSTGVFGFLISVLAHFDNFLLILFENSFVIFIWMALRYALKLLYWFFGKSEEKFCVPGLSLFWFFILFCDFYSIHFDAGFDTSVFIFLGKFGHLFRVFVFWFCILIFLFWWFLKDYNTRISLFICNFWFWLVTQC